MIFKEDVKNIVGEPVWSEAALEAFLEGFRYVTHIDKDYSNCIYYIGDDFASDSSNFEYIVNSPYTKLPSKNMIHKEDVYIEHGIESVGQEYTEDAISKGYSWITNSDGNVIDVNNYSFEGNTGLSYHDLPSLFNEIKKVDWDNLDSTFTVTKLNNAIKNSNQRVLWSPDQGKTFMKLKQATL